MAKHRAANLNGNSPIKHVYKVTDQFTLVIAGNNVQSNGNSSLKLDRNGPRLHSFPLPLVFVPNSHSPRGRSRDYVENRNAYYEFLFRNPIIVIFESSSFRIFIENAIRSQPWLSLRFITREINSHRRTSSYVLVRVTSSRLFPIDHPGINAMFNSAPIIEEKNENERLNTLEKHTYVYSRFFLLANLI